MRLSPCIPFASVLLLVSACKHPVEAPADIDGLAHFFWDEFDAGDDEALAVAVANLDEALQAQSAVALDSAGAYESESMPSVDLTDLTAEEAALVLPGDSRDPALARGILVVNPLPCTVDQVERFTYDLEQDELYPTAYNTYDRQYTSDLDAYVAREAPQLTWTVELTATTATLNYSESLRGGIRYIPDLAAAGASAEVSSPFGAFIINRTWLTEPATFDGESNSFTQDFQLEVQYEKSPGNVIHFFALWRQAEYFGMTVENDGLMKLQTDGLLDWDDETAVLCEAEAAG